MHPVWITDHGAIGDGVHNDTDAVREAQTRVANCWTLWRRLIDWCVPPGAVTNIGRVKHNHVRAYDATGNYLGTIPVFDWGD